MKNNFKDFDGKNINLGDYVIYIDHDATTGWGINGGEGEVVLYEGCLSIKNITPYETFYTNLEYYATDQSKYNTTCHVSTPEQRIRRIKEESKNLKYQEKFKISRKI